MCEIQSVVEMLRERCRGRTGELESQYESLLTLDAKTLPRG